MICPRLMLNIVYQLGCGLAMVFGNQTPIVCPCCIVVVHSSRGACFPPWLWVVFTDHPAGSAAPRVLAVHVPFDWFLLCTCRPRETKTKVAVVEGGREVAAKGNPRALGGVVTRPTTVDPDGATRGASRIGLRRAAVTTIPIPYPLINVTAHIAQTILVLLLATNRMGLTSTVFIVPSDFFYFTATGIFGRLPTSGSIFPFCFGWQTPACTR